MSGEATQKATAATSETIDKVFQEAMRSYEKALKSGIQLQEESVDLWKDLLTKLGSPEEFQAKLESMTADAFPKARKRMEEFVETFNRTSNQTIDLFEKTLGVYQATSVPDAQRRMQDVIESSLAALRVNVRGALNTNAKIIASWQELADRFGPAVKANLIDETERRTSFLSESAKESLNYPPLSSSVLLEVRESESQALESFAKALERQRGLVENAVTPRLTVRFQFPFAASEEDFAKILIEPAPEKSVEVSHWLSPNENLDQLAFLALYPSGRVRTINARAVSKDRRTFVAFEDPICFLDPGSDERPRWPLQGYHGEIDLLALQLPPYET
jgi:hypothetical protein